MSDELESSDIVVIVDSGDQYNVILQGSSTFVNMTDENYYSVSDFATSASYAETASFALFTLQEEFTGSFSGSLDGTASFADNAQTASYVLIESIDGFSEYSQSVAQLFNEIDLNLDVNNTGSFTGSFFGTASYADNAGLLDGTGSATFATTGSNEFFGDQTIFGDIFAEADTLIITGSINLQGNMNISEGIIVLEPIDAPAPVTGGILYSSSGEFFVGMGG